MTGAIYVAQRGWNNPSSSGVFSNGGSGGGEGRVFGDYASYIYKFDASRQVRTTNTTSGEVLVKNIAFLPCIYYL